MKLMTSTFNIAYQTYYDVIDTVIKDGFSVLEIGGGRHPSIRNRKGLDYTIVDPDISELTKSPEDIKQINCTIQELEKEVAEVSKEALTILSDYPYPGNIRELKNILKRNTNEYNQNSLGKQTRRFQRNNVALFTKSNHWALSHPFIKQYF